MPGRLPVRAICAESFRVDRPRPGPGVAPLLLRYVPSGPRSRTDRAGVHLCCRALAVGRGVPWWRRRSWSPPRRSPRHGRWVGAPWHRRAGRLVGVGVPGGSRAAPVGERREGRRTGGRGRRDARRARPHLVPGPHGALPAVAPGRRDGGPGRGRALPRFARRPEPGADDRRGCVAAGRDRRPAAHHVERREHPLPAGVLAGDAPVRGRSTPDAAQSKIGSALLARRLGRASTRDVLPGPVRGPPGRRRRPDDRRPPPRRPAWSC